MFYREVAECPFCKSGEFRLSIRVNDMPSEPWERAEVLTFYCTKCGNKLLEVANTHDGRVGVSGVSVCENCQREFRDAHGAWLEADIPKTTYPPAAVSFQPGHPASPANCPRCGGPLKTIWWRGWNYVIGPPPTVK